MGVTEFESLGPSAAGTTQSPKLSGLALAGVGGGWASWAPTYTSSTLSQFSFCPQACAKMCMTSRKPGTASSPSKSVCPSAAKLSCCCAFLICRVQPDAKPPLLQPRQQRLRHEEVNQRGQRTALSHARRHGDGL
jgi:hypothetical protein